MVEVVKMWISLWIIAILDLCAIYCFAIFEKLNKPI